MRNAIIVITALFLTLPLGAQEKKRLLDRRVSFTQTVKCESPQGSGFLENVEIRLALPRDNDRQRLGPIEHSPKPLRIIEDEFGNLIAVHRMPRLEAGKKATFKWSARARTWGINHDVKASKLESLDLVPKTIRARFLKGGRKYGLDNPRIQKAARDAAKGAKNPLDLAFKLNEFVRERLIYRNDGRWEDAPNVLANGHGSCSEYNFLFMALCRANGLPARFVGATALRSDGPRYEDTIHHRWTEVWLPGYGWYPVDTSRNDGEEGDRANRHFGRTVPQLLVLMKGDGGNSTPLRWGYVSSVSSQPKGDAYAMWDKNFLWEKRVERAGSSGEN